MNQYSGISMVFDDVSAVRGDHHLFAGLSFELKSNEVLWIQGANGIGKTTLLRLAAGLSRPDSGHVSWRHDQDALSSRQVIAFQGHQNALKRDLTAIEDLTFWADIYGFSGDLNAVTATVALTDRMQVSCGALSAGQGRRLAIARLLISQRPIWIMDEPAAAMDKDGQALILDVVNDHVSRGGAALIASHDTARSFSGRTQRLLLESTA